MKAVIYTIKTANGLYVGSTDNFIRRCTEHKSRINKYSNRLLYKNIISNNGIYKIEIYCNVNCRDRRHLEFFEEQYRIILGAKLNNNKCFKTRNDALLEYKNYDKKRNCNKIKCVCGGSYVSRNKSTHLKTQRHINNI